ncbi:MAG: DUF2281 domain-containing protein [Bacteroidetes bacterium]|nr:DUF2281 domain-containing protein [Bacteroidota bacterium]
MSIEEMIKRLPEDLQKEVMDYVQFLLEKRATKKRGRLDFSWEGALRDLKDKYTSVELQHKISEW